MSDKSTRTFEELLADSQAMNAIRTLLDRGYSPDEVEQALRATEVDKVEQIEEALQEALETLDLEVVKGGQNVIGASISDVATELYKRLREGGARE